MNFAALSPTVDALEAARAVLVLVALAVVVFNLRAAWGEMDWALDDADPTMRRLGPSRYANAVFLLAVVLFLALGAFTSLFTPSPIQSSEDTLAVVDSINQRVTTITALVFVTLMGLNDAWWRYDAGRRRAGRDVALADAVGMAEHLEHALAEHKAAIEEATAAVERNIVLTADARDRASAAYEEANTVNQKIERLGIAAEAERGVERAERAEGMR
jgi:hypothetical protein